MKDYIAEANYKISELRRIDSVLSSLYQEKKEKVLDDRYYEILKRRENIVNNIYEILDKLQEYSFFGQDIWEYIVLLISLFEGKEYCYYFSHPCFVGIGCYERELFNGYGSKEHFVEKIAFKDNYFILYYTDNLYTKSDIKLKLEIDFKDYDYVIGYLNLLINFRIANNISKFAPIDRYALEVMKKYIDENRDLLKARRSLRVAEEEQKMDNYFAALLENLDNNPGRKA